MVWIYTRRMYEKLCNSTGNLEKYHALRQTEKREIPKCVITEGFNVLLEVVHNPHVSKREIFATRILVTESSEEYCIKMIWIYIISS